MSDKGILPVFFTVIYYRLFLVAGFINKIKNKKRFSLKKLVVNSTSRTSTPSEVQSGGGPARTAEDDRHGMHAKSNYSGRSDYSDALSGTDMEASSRDDLYSSQGPHASRDGDEDDNSSEHRHSDSESDNNGDGEDDDDDETDETDDHEDDEDYRKGTNWACSCAYTLFGRWLSSSLSGRRLS